MGGSERLQAMRPEERRAFCRRVMERLSDLVEGEAPPDLCARVEEILGDCEPFLAYRNTFAATIDLTRRLGRGGPPSPAAEDAFRRCVEKVRQKL